MSIETKILFQFLGSAALCAFGLGLIFGAVIALLPWWGCIIGYFMTLGGYLYYWGWSWPWATGLPRVWPDEWKQQQRKHLDLN